MREGITRQVEAGVELAAAAMFAAAVGFAFFKLAPAGLPSVGALVAGSSALGFLLCRAVLGRVDAGPSRFWVPAFDPAVIEVAPAEADELLLTDADWLDPGSAGGDDALELDDVLAEIGPDSRAVRLFDRSAMPTPGQFKTRICQHLDAGPSHSPSPDASQALYDALADLRRSLR